MLLAGNVKEILQSQWKKTKNYVLKWKQLGDIAYPDYWVSVGGGCEVAVVVRTRYGSVKFREYGKLLNRKSFLRN